MGFRGIDRKWMFIALLAVSIAVVFGLYYFFLRPNPTITGVVWQRSGGFAGINETLEIESDGSVTLSSNLLGGNQFILSETEWNQLLSVIENSGFTGFEASYEPRSGVADFFIYSLEVKKGSSTKQVEWVDDWASESELPEGLKDIEEHILSIIQGTELGGVEGIVSDELGRPASGLIVSFVEGSVGFPEIAIITDEDGFYQIGSVPPGVFILGVHDEEGERIGQKTFQVVGGEISTIDIVVRARTQYGVIEGKVNIGPFCPVEPPSGCPPPPGTYTSRKIILQTSLGDEISISLNETGYFQARVKTGTIEVNLTNCTFLGCQSALPMIIVIKPDQVTEIVIEIDTGIR